MLPQYLKEQNFFIIAACSLLIAVGMMLACWRMNPWPSDAEVYYMPAAKSLFQHRFLSEMHQGLDEERIKWLHGKELHVLAIALLQRLMGDTETLRPLVLLGVISVFLSSVLIYLVARRLWGLTSALVVWFLFTSSFWPYLYILFTKHQTQGLAMFLFCAFCMVYARYWCMYLAAGAAMGISIFSSTVSTLYLPLAAALFLVDKKRMAVNAAAFFVGLVLIVSWVNWPDILGGLKSYAAYVRISGAMNHFFYNQKVLAQWLPSFDLKNTRGGLWWVVKYLFLVVPSIMVIFWACFYRACGRDRSKVLPWFLLCMSGIIMAEAKGVAQYGANYFPVLIGLLAFIGWSLRKAAMLPWWPAVAAVILCWNAYVFASDIYPSRMVTTRISDFLDHQGISGLYTYRTHLLRPNILDHLNPGTLSRLKISAIESAVQVNEGYILLPPVSYDTIYRASNGDYNDFDSDLLLNNIVRQGKLRDYAVASFKTLGSSLIWSQEEEILAYRYLLLKQFHDSDRNRAWVLDAAKIARDRGMFLPSQEEVAMREAHVYNIGTLTRQNMYPGYQSGVPQGLVLKGLAARIVKVGDPKDALRAFVFKVDDQQPMWVPYSRGFMSQLLPADKISADGKTPATFTFDPPLKLEAGAFYVEIYRTGKPSDKDFYRIQADAIGRITE